MIVLLSSIVEQCAHPRSFSPPQLLHTLIVCSSAPHALQQVSGDIYLRGLYNSITLRLPTPCT
jgi:hypothetical protein